MWPTSAGSGPTDLASGSSIETFKNQAYPNYGVRHAIGARGADRRSARSRTGPRLDAARRDDAAQSHREGASRQRSRDGVEDPSLLRSAKLEVDPCARSFVEEPTTVNAQGDDADRADRPRPARLDTSLLRIAGGRLRHPGRRRRPSHEQSPCQTEHGRRSSGRRGLS